MGFCDEQPKARSQLWMCLADAKHGVKTKSSKTSSATTHLSTQHKVKRTRTAVVAEK